ncbi:MAG TPA: AlkA N-terminal domain-containing protein [Blastocatellia bacterium]|nr:AlkA N-terminal domain-containing protein [Blastocatellia bacterium]
MIKETSFSVTIAYHPPFDWESLLEFLSIRATPGVESVEAGTYTRSALVAGASGCVTISNDPARNRLRVLADGSLNEHSGIVCERVAHLFDLVANTRAIAECLARSRGLKNLVNQYPGLRVPGAWDPFELAVRAIVGQQVTVKAATTLMGRIAERAVSAGRVVTQIGTKGGLDGHWRLFPSPRQIIETDLSRIGAPSSRIETVTRLAKAVAESTVDFSTIDNEALCRQLASIKGIGRWTAGYIAMRTLRHGDSYPYGDLVLRKELSADHKLISAAEVDRAFDAWRPWRSYAALYLWKRASISADS